MKKRFFSLMIGAVIALASCSKSDEVPNLTQSGEQSATFQIEYPSTTRADVADLTRYIVEAYEGNDLNTTPVRVEAATNSLTIELKKDTEYTFVFWADKGTAKADGVASIGYYNTDKLQEVVVTAGKENSVGEVAYCLTKSFNSKVFEANKAVVLKNATSQLNFTEAAGLQTNNNSLTVEYSSCGKLNVATGKITDTGIGISRTYTNIAQIAQDGIVASDYILAPLGEKYLLNLKMTFNSEPEKLINDVPFQQNYKTSVKGAFSKYYSSVFTVSDQVEDYTNNPDEEFPVKAKVGDFYYSDNTYSTTIDAAKTCIGIVFWIDPTNTKKGKIVSLNKQANSRWSTEKIDIGANDANDGAANTAKVLNFVGYTADKYPAFAWCASKNIPAQAGISWYIPAIEELMALYGKYDGGTAKDNSVKTAVNASLSSVGGASVIDIGYHWSSTDNASNLAKFVNFDDGNVNANDKSSGYSVRAVSAF